MNPSIAGALIASVATVVSFALGALTSALATRVSTNRARRERAQVTYSEVVAGVSRFQVAVEDFRARRDSRRARVNVVSEIAFDLVVAVFKSPKRPQDWIGPMGAGYKRVNAWDRDEGDRVATHLDRALVQAHPAIFLLALMDPDLVEPTKVLGKAIQAYADATTERARRTKSAELTKALNDLGFVLGAVIKARWSHVLPRRRKPLPKPPSDGTAFT